MIISTVLVGLTIFLIIVWTRNRQRKFHVLKQIGINGPEPNFIFGNTREIRTKGKWTTYDKWVEQFGRTYGIYDGTKPIIITDDLDLLTDVFIKEFPNFHARYANPLATPDNMFNASGDTWRRLRGIASPTFSALKMKQMSPIINQVVDNLMNNFTKKAQKGEPFDIYSDYQRLTLDVIASCAFGLDVNSIENDDAVFLQKCKSVMDPFNGRAKPSLLLTILLNLVCIFPSSTWIVKYLAKAGGKRNPRQWFREAARKMILERKASDIKRPDFIQLMLEAHKETASADDQDADAGYAGQKDAGLSKDWRARKEMTLEEMEGQSFVFLIAGYETTSTFLAMTSYELALNPDIQSHLQEEVDQYFPEKTCCPDYTTVQKLQYLDSVISESLRLHVRGDSIISRVASVDCTVRGQFIPKGTVIQPDIHGLHMKQELWGPEDTSSFCPDRFLPERKANRPPLAWMPFGGGPRTCMGMRFALMEMKIALVRILKNFTIKRCSKTAVPLPINQIGSAGPSEGVFIVLEPR